MAGMTPQNYYKQCRARRRKEVEEGLLLELVCRERGLQPRLGVRKLLKLLEEDFSEAGIEIGRDRFFELLRRHELLIERRVCSVRTTYSGHRLPVYGNLLKEKTLTGVGQAILSDITYVRTEEGFLYLSLISDGYSRAIVGHDCSDTLEVEGALRALDQALCQLVSGKGTIHHSDRGSQYCCREYVGRLRGAGVAVSMTEESHCYENAQAERLNGILKQEYGLGRTFRTKSEALAAVEEAVWLYNYRRPHASLGYAIPMEVHRAA